MNPLQHNSRPSAKAVLRSGGFHVSTNNDGQRDCRCDSACRGASHVSAGAFAKGAPVGCAEAVAGLTSRHRALLARFARNKDSTHRGRDDLNGKARGQAAIEGWLTRCRASSCVAASSSHRSASLNQRQLASG